MESVRKQFSTDGYNHQPSEKILSGLQEIALAIEAMAKGKLDTNLYVSHMPPGAGKTTTLVHAVRELKQDKSFKDVGIIIFLSRCEEIEKLARQMALSPKEYAIFTSREDLNAITRDTARNRARVLFTTQQQLQARAQGTNYFVDMDVFWFNDQPRQVRIWDEAILPAQTITLGRFDLDALRKGFALDGSQELAKSIDDFSGQVRQSTTGSLVEVPNVQYSYPKLERVRAVFSGSEKTIAESFWRLSRRTVRIRADETSGNTLLDYDELLPSDLAPMVVLDASAEQRKTYELWQRHRKGIRFLPSCSKDYSGLTIHHWNKGAGKSSQWRDEDRTIARGIAKTINETVPDNEDVLVIHHKASNELNLEEDVMRHVEKKKNERSGERRVKFCHWGLHTATNEYSHIKHVFLAGLLMYNAPQYEATARAAGKFSQKHDISDDDYEAVRLGEIAHHLFQAANRGHVRNSIGDACPEGCHLYAVFSSNRGNGVPKALLNRVFPKAAVVEWRPVYKPTGNAAKLVDMILRHRRLLEFCLPKKLLMERLHITDRSQFNRLLRHPEVQGALAEQDTMVDYDHKHVRIHAAKAATDKSSYEPFGPLEKPHRGLAR